LQKFLKLDKLSPLAVSDATLAMWHQDSIFSLPMIRPDNESKSTHKQEINNDIDEESLDNS